MELFLSLLEVNETKRLPPLCLGSELICFFFFDFFLFFGLGASLLLLLLLLLLGRGVAVRRVIFKNKKAAPSPPDALGVVAFVRAAFLVLFFSFYS